MNSPNKNNNVQKKLFRYNNLKNNQCLNMSCPKSFLHERGVRKQGNLTQIKSL